MIDPKLLQAQNYVSNAHCFLSDDDLLKVQDYIKSLTTEQSPVAKLKCSDGLSALVEDWERQLKFLKISIDDAGESNDFWSGLMWQYHHQKLSMCLSQLKIVMGI